MIYFFAFFELGGGCVFSIAPSASSNFSGCRVSFSRFCFGLGFRVFTNPFNYRGPQSSGEPIPSNTLPIGQVFSFGLVDCDFHPLSIGDSAVVLPEREFISVALQNARGLRGGKRPSARQDRRFPLRHAGNNLGASFPMSLNERNERRLAKVLPFVIALPSTNVSSISTVPLSKSASAPSFIAKRIRCAMNHADL